MLLLLFAKGGVKHHPNITGFEAQILRSDEMEFTKGKLDL